MTGNVIDSFDMFLKSLPESGNWFRGHSIAVNKLCPKVFREPLFHSEVYLYNTFKLMAPAYYSDCPSDLDYFRWLCLMQHYKMATRLLDWTTNPLYALYFAVRNREEHGSDGELWTLNYRQLNDLTKMSLPLITDSIDLQYMCEEGFYAHGKGCSEQRARDELKARYKVTTVYKYPLAVFPIHEFERMKAQQSTFTIHSFESKDTDWHLETVCGVTRFIIPSSSKPNILKMMNKMGVRESAIYPSLESLSNDIMFNIVF